MSRRRVALVGIDGFSPYWMDHFLAQGVLPRIGELASRGVTVSLRSTLPATTPVAWATVATGCPPTTTGIDANLLHRPGDPLDRRLGCYAHRCEAEPVWATAAAARRRSYVVKFPVSYPSSTATFRLDGAAGWAGMKCLHEFGPAAVADTRATRSGNALRSHGEAWTSEAGRDGTTLWRGTWLLSSLWGKKPLTLHVSVRRSRGGEIRVALADRPDWRRVLAHVAPGGWSEPITVRAEGRRGETEVSFRCKVLDCSGEPLRLRLYNTVVHERRGHSEPAEVWDRHLAAVGPIEEQTDPFLLFDQGIDLETQWELFRINADWLERVAVSLLAGEPWDLFMMQVHFTDWAHHILEGGLDPRHPEFRPDDAPRFERALLDSYRMADTIVGAVRDSLGPDDDLVVLGDHGQDLHHTTVHVNEWLASEGLLAWDGDEGEVDWERTRAFAAGNFVYINQEGREPTGIVPPGEAKALTRRICRGLLGLEDPERGVRPILIAGGKEDFRALGGNGKGVGDVVFLCRSGYQARNNPGALFEPTRLLREFTSGHDHFSPLDPRIRTRLFAAGPSFRSGHRNPRVASLTDVTPTLCAVLGIDPAPGFEGRVLTDLLTPAVAGRAQPPAALADAPYPASEPPSGQTSSPSAP